jgi:hypothetical protein
VKNKALQREVVDAYLEYRKTRKIANEATKKSISAYDASVRARRIYLSMRTKAKLERLWEDVEVAAEIHEYTWAAFQGAAKYGGRIDQHKALAKWKAAAEKLIAVHDALAAWAQS